MFGLPKSKWLDKVFLLIAVVIALALYFHLYPIRVQEEFWEKKVASLIGLDVEIGDVDQESDGTLTFSNIKVFNHTDFVEDDFILIPSLISSPGRNSKHFKLEFQNPTFNYYHSGTVSNAANFFREMRSRAKSSLPKSNKYQLDIKVTSPEMFVLYSRETGKQYVSMKIIGDNREYRSNTEYAVFNPELKSYKLRTIRGNEETVAVKAGIYFLSKVDALGRKYLGKYESEYYKFVESRRLQDEKDENRRKPKKKKKHNKRLEYEPVQIR